jgi:hypothetical protein
MFWDPYFGWDWNEVLQAFFVLVGLLAFFGLFGATEHNDFFYLYRKMWAWAERHNTALLGVFIVSLIGGFYYWRFQGGDLS